MESDPLLSTPDGTGVHAVADPFLETLPVAEVLGAVAAGTAETMARFRYDVRTNAWWWSEEMFALHGLSRESVVPSTEILMAHKHPEDLLGTEGTLQGVLATGEPFCCRHRIIDAAGNLRHVLSIGAGVVEHGRVVAVHGYFVDLTEFVDHPSPFGGLTVLEPTAFDAVVEHAKGVLVAAYRLTPEAALELLRWSASQSHVPLAELSRHLVREFAEAGSNAVSPAVRADRILGLGAGPRD